MDTFEELGLQPELADALMAEGIEVPTTLQQEAIPLLRKGNSALLRGGAGSGVLVAYGAPLLDRAEGGQGKPEALVLTSLPQGAVELARSLARPAGAVGLRVAALNGPFALPSHADVLFATPAGVAAAISNGELKLDQVSSLVLEGAGALLSTLEDRGRVEALMDLLPSEELQVVVTAEPVTQEVRDLVRDRVRRAVFIPSDAGTEPSAEGAPVRRGELQVRGLEGDETGALAALAGELLADGARHLLLFFRNEDRAADLGDLLTLHGFAAGSPGDDGVPIWLGVNAMEARRAMDAEGASTGVVVVSVDVPSDPDELDRRHGGGRTGGVILARPRETGHLRRIAGEAGYDLSPLPVGGKRDPAGLQAFSDMVEAAIRERDLGPYHLVLEPLVSRYGSAEVAAALAALLRARRTAESESGPGLAPPADPGGRRVPPAFVRLFLSIGSRDGVGPGDLLGAITGEAGIPGSRVGRIDVRESFSRVEVDEEVAEAVIRSLNGTTLRSRSIRADYDRSQGRGPEKGQDRGPSRRGGREGTPSRGRGAPRSGPGGKPRKP
jgi:ATP-dependent RNA helicase DeaD